jgi:ABC-type oligopeptide transport system substrate-binding subunit
MKRDLRVLAAAGSLLLAFSIGEAAYAQKPGGTLKMYFFDSPASMSIHEEATVAAQGPMMGVFNNLVMYDQHVAQSSLNSIVPDLATEWSWEEDKTALTLRLRQGVKWHDGKPFTAKDVNLPAQMDRLFGAISRSQRYLSTLEQPRHSSIGRQEIRHRDPVQHRAVTLQRLLHAAVL